MSPNEKPIDEGEITIHVELINSDIKNRRFTNVKDWSRHAEGLTIVCYGTDKPVHFIPTGEYAIYSVLRKPVQ